MPDAPGVGRVGFGDLRRVTPISANWGYDRGRPIDRYYIETFLAGHAGDIRGRTLEIADDTYTRRFGEGRVTRSDVLHAREAGPGVTIVADLTAADAIAGNTFDCIIFTQTLQLIYDVRAAIRTLHRVLRPAGVALATMPGITRVVHDEWGDDQWWAFTARSAKRLFAEAFGEANVDAGAHGNLLAATAFLQGLAVEELSPAELDYHDRRYEVIVTVRAVKR
jgi:SAM-dependent methyltransferase